MFLQNVTPCIVGTPYMNCLIQKAAACIIVLPKAASKRSMRRREGHGTMAVPSGPVARRTVVSMRVPRKLDERRRLRRRFGHQVTAVELADLGTKTIGVAQ